jgi:hypothetical protein
MYWQVRKDVRVFFAIVCGLAAGMMGPGGFVGQSAQAQQAPSYPVPRGMPKMPAGVQPYVRVQQGRKQRDARREGKRPAKQKGGSIGGGPGGSFEIYGRIDPRNPRFAVVGAKKPIYYVVRPGDTLWDISATYFQDPWYWPKLWAMNPSITNPHWIYPGDRLRLQKAKQTRKRPRRRARQKGKAFGVVEPQVYDPEGTVSLRQTGYIEEEKIKNAGVIKGAFDAKIMLATYDVIYIKMKRKNPLKVGERYTIFKPVKKVKYPGTKRHVGRMVKIYADVEIKSVRWGGPYKKRGVARGVILRAVNPVERGFLVGKLKRRFKTIKAIKNKNPKLADVSGQVIAVLDQNEIIGTKQMVFIDRGKLHHIKLGHVFFVVRRGDAYRRTMEKRRRAKPAEAHYPPERLAALVVVDVGKRHCAAIVQSELRAVQVGDQVVLQYSGPKVEKNTSPNQTAKKKTRKDPSKNK